MLAINSAAQTQKVKIETTAGTMLIVLSDLTPLHRDNFVKNVREGYYNGLTFHRIIPDFMVQTGDWSTRNVAKPKQYEHYTIPAEVRVPQLYHRRGAVAMAREDISTNPSLASSGQQFFFVWGKQWSERQVEKYCARTLEQTGIEITPDSAMINDYWEHGGTPYLDGTYTVFGHIIEGLEVVDSIQHQPAGDVRILRAVCE